MSEADREKELQRLLRIERIAGRALDLLRRQGNPVATKAWNECWGLRRILQEVPR